MSYDYAAMPDCLPEKPKGWTMQMVVHFNFGGAKGAASYTVYDNTNREMPFVFGYNTVEKWRGFILPGIKPVMSWIELRNIWPVWLSRARTKQAKERQSVEGKSEKIRAIK